MVNYRADLRRVAREIFAEALSRVDAARSLRRAVCLDGSRLTVGDSEFDLSSFSHIFSIAIGKAARPMAISLSDILSDKLTAGVLSAPRSEDALPRAWRAFEGGHPLPNDASLQAARAARDLLLRADSASALVIFLVSGGGSAMMELPRSERVSLADLREMNRVLVGCGATIAEINAVRRRLSFIKGGGLSRMARRAAQISLIVSDTNRGEEANVASGPTLVPRDGDREPDVAAIIARYNLRQALPPSVMSALDLATVSRSAADASGEQGAGSRKAYVLLDNEHAIEAAREAAQTRGFIAETAPDLVEQPVAQGCHELVTRTLELRRRAAPGTVVCLVSGGEFVCPVRGSGIGGRNSEAALRCAIEIDSRAKEPGRDWTDVVALHAGTDGIDGNSPAAGAVSDRTTLARAKGLGLDAAESLGQSDAYNFFKALGDTIETGPTGTNVRDLRIMLAT